jgi:hypothetical protein
MVGKRKPKSNEIGECLNTDETVWMEIITVHNSVTILFHGAITKRDGER